MDEEGLPWPEVRSKRVPHEMSLEDIKRWRADEGAAGRPSGFEDYCRAFGRCMACLGEGVTLNDGRPGFKAVGWDGKRQLFQRCRICGGTGKAY
jgi:hypothetical protein